MSVSDGSPSSGNVPESNSISFGSRVPGSQWLVNIPIVGKLTLGFGIVVLSTLIVIALSLASNTRVLNDIARTNDLRAPLALVASQAQADLLTIVADVRGYLALGDSEYQVSYISASLQFENEIQDLELLLDANPDDMSISDLRTPIDTLQSTYDLWQVLPDQLFALHDDQLQREPALRILIEEGNPAINQVSIATRSIIQSQRQREPTDENMDVLADIANFQTTYFTLVSALRSYVATGNSSFKFEYDSNLLANDQAWENLNTSRDFLYFNQENQLQIIESNRTTFLDLTPQIFDATEGEHAREDLYLFRTEAVPLTNQMLTILSDITLNQQQLLQSDLQRSSDLLSITRIQNLIAGIIIVGLGSLFAAIIARNIVSRIHHLTVAAEKIGRGDLTSRAEVTSGDEIGTLANAFNSMAEQLHQTLEDLEHRRREQEAIAEVLRQRNEYFEALNQTTIGLMSRLELNELLEAIIARVGQLLHAKDGFIYLNTGDAETPQLEIKIGLGVFESLIGLTVTRSEGLGGIVWETGEPLIIDHYDEWEARISDFEYGVVGTTVAIPLMRSSDEAGKPIGVLGLAYHPDVSMEIGKQELELLEGFSELASIAIDNARLFATAEKARHAAEEADRSKSDFLSSVSHELRTPLTSVMGFAKIIERELERGIFPNLQTDDRKTKRAVRGIREDLSIIIDEGQRLTTLINNVLDLAKIEAGKIEWDIQPISIQDVIQWAASATDALFEQKDVSLIVDIPDSLPQVNADQDKLIQVVINLISNAVKFTDDGTVTCRATIADENIQVSVIDTGCGIAKEDQPKVFEKFKQVGDTLTDKPQGTGLGLPICKEIIVHHEGRIWVESELGKGSTFIFTLPI